MKFKAFFSVPIIISLCLLSYPGNAAAKAKKKENKSENIKTTALENSKDVVGPDSVAVLIPIQPDIRASYCRSAKSDSVLRLAVVLSDINSNKDKEFSRGFLMGLQNIDIPDGSLSLKMINGNIEEDSLRSVLAQFNPGVIVSTHEKETPKTIFDYAQTNFVKFISAFDAKGEDYKKYPGVYQLLTPSVPFNENSAATVLKSYPDHTLLIIGEMDPSDQILRELMVSWPEDNMMLISREDLPEFRMEEGMNYLIYPIVSGEGEINAVLSEIRDRIPQNPLTGIRVLGRPNWVAFNNLNKMVEGIEVLVPAKCYFDPTAEDSKRFIKEYKENYEKTPIKSYPVYSAMGYDAARYFVPVLIGELRGTTGEWPREDMIQSYFCFGDDGWNQGAYNKGTYILHFLPANNMQKDLVD